MRRDERDMNKGSMGGSIEPSNNKVVMFLYNKKYLGGLQHLDQMHARDSGRGEDFHTLT